MDVLRSGEHLLEGLNDHQREAVAATTGPVAILAGAGTGKTRVISHRVAYAAATGAVDPARVLLVTFTDKAANEMVERVRALGLPGVAALTFHAAALRQLRYFWPLHHDGAPLPDVLDSKARILGRLARELPGGYRFTPAKDLADEIEWAKSRRITPDRYIATLPASRTPPIPAELFTALYRRYEQAKDRQGLLDFDDMLLRLVDLLESDEASATLVRRRYTWFSVDEYQDTSPLQQRLLELWLGESRDVCVVGDEDQTIYTFTGASPDHLTGFASRYPDARVVALEENYRSSPEVLALANRLIASTGRTKALRATRPSGPAPTVRRFEHADDEVEATVAAIGRVLRDGTDPQEIALLVRTNAQLLPWEEALTRAGIGFRLRGPRFYERPEVRRGLATLRRTRPGETGASLVMAVRERWRGELGFDPEQEPETEEARQQHASLRLLLGVLEDLVRERPATDAAAFLAEIERRDEAERSGAAGGVALLTLHRAKGLEWDAVFLPSLEEGTLPIRQALDEPDALDEERRLLYVGITRARRHLALSWAARRVNAQGREGHREMSRFLRDLGSPSAPARPTARPASTAGGGGRAPVAVPATDDALFAALRAWRLERARADKMAPFIVAHDALLAEIARFRPRSLASLRQVKGMGPSKVERFGEEILEVVERVAGGGADVSRDGPSPA